MYSHFTFTNRGKQYNISIKQRYREAIALQEKIILSDKNFIQAETKEISLDGAKINFINALVSSPTEINVKHDFPFIKIHFELEGRSEYRSTISKGETVIIPDGCFNFFYLPQVEGTLTYPSSKRKSLEITLTEKFLKNIFKTYWETISSEFGFAIQNQQSYKMFEEGVKIPSALLVIIQEIILCTYEQEIKEIFLVSKITEILSFLFAEIAQADSKLISKSELKASEYQEILQAEKILRENYKNPPTIKNLSLQTGINQCKLKTNFKKVYYQPIFQYLTKFRMDKARALIIAQDNITIAEVAYAVGYKNPQHFTVAFKKRYNYLPSDLKNKVHQSQG